MAKTLAREKQEANLNYLLGWSRWPFEIGLNFCQRAIGISISKYFNQLMFANREDRALRAASGFLRWADLPRYLRMQRPDSSPEFPNPSAECHSPVYQQMPRLSHYFCLYRGAWSINLQTDLSFLDSWVALTIVNQPSSLKGRSHSSRYLAFRDRDWAWTLAFFLPRTRCLNCLKP